ncbi:MAG: hypothetical protein GY801_51325 [bacterium]|nr:hypothetical protein [bacterium]
MILPFPPKSLFPNSAPRYPNLWILVSDQLADTCKIGTYRNVAYRNAFKFVVEHLEEATGMFNDYGYFHTAEGCDAVARRRGLQYIELGENGELSHDHEFHIRFYTQALRAQGIVEWRNGGYYPICASVHYEVDRPSNLHPYVDACPICGCVGEDEQYYDAAHHNRASDRKNEMLHDPLGLEAALFGTIKGTLIPLFRGLNMFENRYRMEIHHFESPREDINTKNLGLVVFHRPK